MSSGEPFQLVRTPGDEGGLDDEPWPLTLEDFDEHDVHMTRFNPHPHNSDQDEIVKQGSHDHAGVLDARRDDPTYEHDVEDEESDTEVD